MTDQIQSEQAQQFKLLVDNYQRHRDYIIHEDGLVNNRVGWFIQLHTFLLATYGIVLGSAVSTFYAEHGPTEAQSLMLRWILCLVLAGLTAIGVCSATSARRSILAAHKAIHAINDRWELQDAAVKAEFPGLIGGGDLSSDEHGARLHRFLPSAMLVMWILSCAVPAGVMLTAYNPGG